MPNPGLSPLSPELGLPGREAREMLRATEGRENVGVRSHHVRHRRLVATVSLAESPLVAFMATRHAARARAFYESTLGLRVIADTPFALVLDSRGTTVRIQKVETLTPHPFTSLGWKVADIAKTIDDLRGRGVVFERYPSLPQDEAGIWTTPDGSRVAWFKDPDGNTLSLTQPGPPEPAR
jgi:catechol 2,3-dioxygenase-like lactoylglutathione lyase family enzyme